jgi:Calcineurin-like phosphoesterase
MLHLRSSRSTLLPVGALAIAAALSACGQNNQPSVSTGSASVSVQALSAGSQVTVTISGPALYAPQPVTLSPQGSGGSYGALISSLPVGSNYVFTVNATDTNNDVYQGSATNIAIVQNQVTTVVITAQLVNPPANFVNTVPVIDSLTVSSTNIAPGGTITAKVQAHDDQKTDTITYAWSSNPAGGSFSAPTGTTTTWTAPATEGNVTLKIQVQDNHGATTSASIVIHVSNANGTGQADVNVQFNNWPVVSDVIAVPGWITLGAPVSLTVTASDSDGDALSYLWSTGATCTSGKFTSGTSAAPTFTLPVSATDTYCEFDVAVSDGRGGSTTGTMYLPVGAPPSISAPLIVDAAQSAPVVDASSPVLFSVEASDPQGSAMTFVWSTSAPAGSLTGQTDTSTTSQVTLTAPAAGSADVSVTVTDALGASTKYDFSATICTPPAATAWKFGVMADTQWTTGDPAGQNPTTVAVSIIDQLNPIFIKAGVKFVIQVGDLADTGNDADETVRAQAAQPLYDAGIGFFPMRGNHETYGTGNSFAIPVLQSLYPQTRGLSQTFGATNFSSPTSVSAELDGMSYSFDYNNARFVIVDPWVTPSVDISQAGYDFGYSITQQQPWISSRLDKSTRGTDHAFVMSHQPLMAESHQDTMFQGYTNANPDMQNAFYASLQANNVKYYMAGHDHMNQHSIMASPDGLSSVHELIGSSDSSKFYTPKSLTDTNWFGQKTRETSVAQELYTVGYYIFTVDGPNVTVDFYSDNHGGWLSDASYPLGAGRPDTNVTPLFNFVKKQSWGYSQNGTEFLVAQGASYPTTPFTFGGTTAQFLAGTNSSTVKDYSNRALPHAVDIGWDAATCETASAIMYLWGTADLGAASGDTIVLSMSFDPSSVSAATLASGGFGLATQQDSSGNWTNAVVQNAGGMPVFHFGAWNASYGLGDYGVDTTTNTVWAVVNHAGRFAAVRF